MVVSPSPPSPSVSPKGSRRSDTPSSLYSVGLGRRRGSLPRYIDVRIRDDKRDKWTSTVPPHWEASKETTPHPPFAIRSELKRVLLSDNVTEQKFLMAKLERIDAEKHKKLEQIADKKIKFIDDLTRRKNPYIQSIKFGFEERLNIVPRLKSKDGFTSLRSAPVVRDAAAFLTEHRQAEAASSQSTPRLPFLQLHPASAPLKRKPSTATTRQLSVQSLPDLNGTHRFYHSPKLALGHKERKTLSKKCVKDERFLKLEKILVQSDDKKKEPVWRRAVDSNQEASKPVSTWELHRRRRNSLV